MADQSNPSRKALTIGAVLGVLSASAGAYLMFTHEEASVDTNIGRGEITLEELNAHTNEIQAYVSKDRLIVDLPAPDQDAEGNPRNTNFFFSPQLWEVGIQSKKENTVIDILDPTAPNVHGDVPNIWFVKSGIADAFASANALTMDSDKDGFTNLEEYNNQTKPADKTSYPALIGETDSPKLRVAKVAESNAYITLPLSLTYADAAPESVKVRIFRRLTDSNAIIEKDVKPSEKFGVSASEADRFVLVGFEKKTYKGVAGEAEEFVARIRDTKKPEGTPDLYVRAGKPRAHDNETPVDERKGRHIQDKTVTFNILAGSALGTPQAVLSVDATAVFTIPGHKDIKYTVQSIDADGTVNITPEGGQVPVNIPKTQETSN